MKTPVRVKICGITSLEDARMAVAAGADALGFMFHPASPRYVSPEAAGAIARALPPFVARVGVFVNTPADVIQATLETAGLDTLQLHGDESPAFCAAFSRVRVIKAFRVDGPAVLDRMQAYTAWAWLLDSHVSGTWGGTGKTFNWDLAREAILRGGTVLLAGGLHPDNVRSAVRSVGPYGVDVSSGVESCPGRKDPERVRAFVSAAKGCGEPVPVPQASTD
jgi:phosphoribosylanthranilate isomerase